MRRVIKLTRASEWDDWRNSHGRAILCHSRVRHYYRVSYNLRTIWLVLTDVPTRGAFKVEHNPEDMDDWTLDGQPEVAMDGLKDLLFSFPKPPLYGWLELPNRRG